MNRVIFDLYACAIDRFTIDPFLLILPLEAIAAHLEAAYEAISVYGIHCVLRTGGLKMAAGTVGRRYHILMEANHSRGDFLDS